MRARPYLIQRYRRMLGASAPILAIAAALQLLPWAWAPLDPAHLVAFLAPAAVLILVAVAAARLAGRPPSGTEPLTLAEGGVVVVASWTLVMLVSAWPFQVLAGLPVTLAAFEAVSGWTTTGLSVVDVEALPPSLLVWRSLSQFAGGAGWAVLASSALAHPFGAALARAEGRERQLAPQIRRSARLVLGLYLGYAGAGALAYLAVGLTPFDALNHALTAVSTGGFSTRAASIGHWDSASVEAVTIVLMALGATSFLVVATAGRRGRRRARPPLEPMVAALVLPVAIAVLAGMAARGLAPSTVETLRLAAFEVVSASTTTGFTTLGERAWPAFGVALVVLLMIVGGGQGSTAGGLKGIRVLMALRLLAWEATTGLRPRRTAARPTLHDGFDEIELDAVRIRRLVAVLVAYAGSAAAVVLILSGAGAELGDALFEAVSALSTVGLSSGIVGPEAPPAVLVALMAAMVVGRLEFLVVLASLAKIAADLRRGLRR